jgi:hypothetical protein
LELESLEFFGLELESLEPLFSVVVKKAVNPSDEPVLTLSEPTFADSTVGIMGVGIGPGGAIP